MTDEQIKAYIDEAAIKAAREAHDLATRKQKLAQQEWLTIAQTCEIMQCTYETVRRRINAGELVTNQKTGKGRRISRGSIKRYINPNL